MGTSPRAEAIRHAHTHLLTIGEKRAKVFDAVACQLTEGPARLPVRHVVVATGLPRRKADALLTRLIDDGWLIVTAPGVPAARRIPGCGPKAKVGRVARKAIPGTPAQPRELDLGPAVVRVLAQVG